MAKNTFMYQEMGVCVLMSESNGLMDCRDAFHAFLH